MKYLPIILACLVAIVAAANSNENNSYEFSQLTTTQRSCIANITKADTSGAVGVALKNCHTTHGGLACVKAIPALSSCFT